MKLKPIPQSKAKTAYGLVSDVIRAMEEEPKRVDMNVLTHHVSPENGGPACGTVGCFAGWTSLLKGGCPADPRLYFAGRGYGPEEGHALQLLGECDYDDPRIDPDWQRAQYVFKPEGADLHGRPGTRQYARSVINRIKRFQKKNAAYLRARKIGATT